MTATRLLLPAAMVLIGLGIVGRTVLEGGGPLSTGLIVGLLFVAAGAGRLWAERSGR